MAQLLHFYTYALKKLSHLCTCIQVLTCIQVAFLKKKKKENLYIKCLPVRIYMF